MDITNPTCSTTRASRPCGSGVVALQRVDESKIAFSRKLRREMTPAEAILWERVRGNRICGVKIRRQQVINGFIADFYCDAARLVIELDGSIHQRPDIARKDRIRREVFEARRLAEIRFSNDEVVGNTDEVVAKLVEEVSKRLVKS